MTGFYMKRNTALKWMNGGKGEWRQTFIDKLLARSKSKLIKTKWGWLVMLWFFSPKWLSLNISKNIFPKLKAIRQIQIVKPITNEGTWLLVSTFLLRCCIYLVRISSKVIPSTGPKSLHLKQDHLTQKMFFLVKSL